MSDQWPVLPASDVCDINIGGTPSRDCMRLWSSDASGHPWASIADISGRTLRATKERISNAGVAGSNVKLVNPGTVVMSFKLSIGRTAITEVPLYTNEAIAAFVPKSGRIIPGWLYYVLPGIAGASSNDQAIKGATLNKQKLARLPIPIPPLDEQRRIAAILDASEATIRATETVIEKLRLEREGIVLRLMEEAEGTELITLGTLLDRDGGTIQTGPFGSQLHSWEYQREGTPVVMPQDIDLDWDHISPEKVARISRRRANDLSRHAMAPGDIVFARRGDLIRAATIVESRRGWLCGTGCFLLRTVGVAINPKWLVLAYRSPTVQRQVSVEATGTTMPNLNGTIMRGLRLNVPNREQQDQVVQIIEAATTGINVEHDKLAKLRVQHQGLLHDLLTGAVRTHA